MFGLVPDISSLDSRAKHGNDSTFFPPVILGLSFLSCHPRALFSLLSSSDKRSAFRGSLDIRVKPEYDRKEVENDNRKRKPYNQKHNNTQPHIQNL